MFSQQHLSFSDVLPSSARFSTSPHLLFLLARYFSHNAKPQLPRGTGIPPTALAPPRGIALRIPTIAPFPIPQKWVRPAFLPPPSPPRPSSPAPAPKEKDARDGTMEQGGIVDESISGGGMALVSAERDEGGGENAVAGDERRKEGTMEADKTSGVDEQRSNAHDQAEGPVEKNASRSGRSNEDQPEKQAVSGTDDKAQPPEEASADCSDGAAGGIGKERGIGDEELSTKDQDKSAGNVTGAEGKGKGKEEKEVTEQKQGAPRKTSAAGAKNLGERDQQDGRKVDAKVDAEAGAKADAKMITEPGSKADTKGQAEKKDSPEDKLSAPEAEAKTNADAEAKAKAEAEAKAKAEAEAKAKAEVKARAAETIAEKRARRLRVSLILRRLNKDVDRRRGTARYMPSANPFSAPWAVRASSGRGVAGAIIAVPGLRDSGSGSVGVRFSAETSDGGRAGDGNGDDNTTVGSGGGTGWPPLGARRVKPVLDRARRLAALGRGPGPVLRLSSFAAEKDKPEGKGTGDWLEAKLARMRKVEDGEWKAWHQRVSEEASSSPGEAAGPVLPYGFAPRLAHRALGAYSLVRTMSRPLRLTPASSVAFLRAMSLKLRTPLLDAMHCELLRRVFCLLKGRAGTWSKGTSAQRELDWKYLDQVKSLVLDWYSCLNE